MRTIAPGSRVLVEVTHNRWAFGTAQLVTNLHIRVAIDGERMIHDWTLDRVRPVAEQPRQRPTLETLAMCRDPSLRVTQPKHTMPIGMAAQIVGVSPSYLHRLDAQLSPVRDGHGRRWYDPTVVAHVAEQRAAKRAGGAR